MSTSLSRASGHVASAPRRFTELESVRGLAAILVVFYHIPIWNPLIDIRFIKNGYLMVDLFFVLSGFVIAAAYDEKLRSVADLLRFQWLRFGRLYPLHLLFLLIFFGVEILRLFAAGSGGGGTIRVQAFSSNSWEAFVQQIFLIQAIGPTGNAYTFNRPAWSISVEFYIYVIFAAITLSASSLRQYIFAAISSLAMLALASGYLPQWEDLLRGLTGFFLGALVMHFHKGQRAVISAFTSTFATIAFVGFIWVNENKELAFLAYFLSAIFVFVLVNGQESIVHRALKIRPLLYLGKISYSIYMCHAFVIWCTSVVLKYFLVRPEYQDAEGVWILSLSPVDVAISTMAILITTISFAAMLNSYLEQPVRAWSREFSNTSPFFRKRDKKLKLGVGAD